MPVGNPITVGIVEDSEDTRQALAFIVNNAPGLKCIGACASAEEAMRSFSSKKPDVVLCDIHLPGLSGIGFVEKMSSILPETHFLMLTILEDYDAIFGALRAGATGYLTKSSPPGKLLEAIHEIYTGGSPMSSQVARQVISAWVAADKPKELPRDTAEKFSHSELSEREREVLGLISRGLLYKEVADSLGISHGTVRTHIQRIYRKLHVRSKIEAMRKLQSS